jgi:hypothetical protein
MIMPTQAPRPLRTAPALVSCLQPYARRAASQRGTFLPLTRVTDALDVRIRLRDRVVFFHAPAPTRAPGSRGVARICWAP